MHAISCVLFEDTVLEEDGGEALATRLLQATQACDMLIIPVFLV